MKPITLIAPVLLAASLTIVSLATAQPTPPQPSTRGEHGAGRDDDRGPGPNLQLTEAQQDKLFALGHAAAPARRDREKAIRRAQDGLRELAESSHFDEAKAAALAQTLGQAFAAEEVDHAREQARFLALLTPEQRAAMQEEKAQHGPGRREEDRK
jgi:protein CpxP